MKTSIACADADCLLMEFLNLQLSFVLFDFARYFAILTCLIGVFGVFIGFEELCADL